MGRNNTKKGSSLKTAITIGNFDGVHKGHVWLLSNFKKLADAFNLKPVVLSFYGHPRAFKEALPLQYLLTTVDERESLITSCGINEIHFIKLDRKTMSMSPEEFIKDILIKQFNMSVLFMGFNHHFGKNREGTPQKVATFVNSLGFSLFVAPPFKIGDKIVSSTLIRELLRKGKVKEATKYLGRPYKICGTVIRGRKLARKFLGIKTANVELSPLKLLPYCGIYAVFVYINGDKFKGTLYIGNNPTLKKEFSFEVHIMDFEKAIYGKEICVEFIERIRENKKFEDVNSLKKAIMEDIEKAYSILTL